MSFETTPSIDTLEETNSNEPTAAVLTAEQLDAKYAVTPSSVPAVNLTEVKDLLFAYGEELDTKDPQFDQKHAAIVERRNKQNSVRETLFGKVLDGTATKGEVELVTEYVTANPHQVKGFAKYQSSDVFMHALRASENRN